MARPTRPSAVKRASTLKVRVLVAQRALLYPCAPLSAAAVGGVRVVAFVGGGFMTRALAARGLSNGLSSDILSHVTDIHATVLALTADDGSEDDDTTQVEAVLDGSAGETQLAAGLGRARVSELSLDGVAVHPPPGGVERPV